MIVFRMPCEAPVQLVRNPGDLTTSLEKRGKLRKRWAQVLVREDRRPTGTLLC